MTSPADRILGCVLGLALGGAPDATAMARNLVRSLGERERLDTDDLIERHLAWFRTDPPDVGTLTRLVLERVSRGARAEEAARDVWEQRGPEVSAGNGSVMYCAPLGAAYANRTELVELAPLLSSLTHHDERCGTACLAVTLAAAAFVRGEPREQAWHEVVTRTLDRPGGEELEYLVEAAGEVRRVDGPDRSFCLFTAGLGLQAALSGESFEVGMERVTAFGGDTARNAAVAGALLGARHGVASIPNSWFDRLQDRDAIEHEAAGLNSLAERTT